MIRDLPRHGLGPIFRLARDDDFTGGSHGAVPEPGMRGARTMGAPGGNAARSLRDVRRASAHGAEAATAALSCAAAGDGKLPAAIDRASALNYFGGG